MMGGMEEKVRDFIRANFADAVVREDNFRNQQSFYIRAEELVHVCRALWEDPELDVRFLSDITSLDWLGHEEEKHGRFEVIYNLYSLRHKYRLFLKVRLGGDNPHIGTLSHIWAGANLMEREVWDMMGIVFDGHPDLTKLLTPDEFEGHPLRKDFPLTYEQPQFSWNKDEPPEVIR
jgi:NADH-quinone oxidoreductase subunit C